MKIVITDSKEREVCSFEAWDLGRLNNCRPSHYEVDDEGDLVLILKADF